MKNFVRINRILEGEYDDKKVAVRGWAYRARSSGKLAFVLVRDTTGVIQTTISQDAVSSDQFEQAKEVGIEASVRVEGRVAREERAPGGWEIHATRFKVLGEARPFPIREYKSTELLLSKRHLWVRSQRQAKVMRIKASVLKWARVWFERNGFHEVTPPTITSNACEGGTTLFEFDYFGKKAYLSQSAQLYLEALIYSLERVWSLTPSFRAERSKTRRHLTEYWHLEAEEAWADHEENLRLQEQLICFICRKVAVNNSHELKDLGREPEDLFGIKPPFKRMKYANAVEFLQHKGYRFEYGGDFGTKEERALTLETKKPLFITNFPVEIKPFYMREDPKQTGTYLCADMLAPEGFGEIIGSSERETSVEKLLTRLKKDKMPIEDYEWYLDLRRYGSVQHSGFGIGVERLVTWLCKLDHVREATPFPRTLSRVYP